MDRSWMYDRFKPNRRGLKLEFVRGVQEFIKQAKEQPCFLSERTIKCPCATCKCVKSFTPKQVIVHLHKTGFKPNYSIWTEHGELEQNICLRSRSNSSGHMEEEEEEEEDPETPRMEEEEEDKEEEDPETPQEMDSHEQTADGKVLIRPYGRGWAPSSAPAAAIKHAIQSHFQGPFHCWSETPEDVREYWWKLFGDKVAWDPDAHGYIKKTFESRGAKRLSDMLSKVRKKGTRPHWICEEAWKGLIAHWEGQAFKNVSTRNKTNRASGKGGAVHTTGRKAHVDVALSMSRKLGRSVDPDELFLATHKKKSGNWVDIRSQTTYKHYQDRLKEVQTQIGEEVQTQIGEDSLNGMQEVDGATKLELWKEVAGGKTRGRCYGTADLSLNLQHGVATLTQEIREPYPNSCRCDQAVHLEAIDAARKEAAAARQEAATARQEAAKAKQHYRLLDEQLRTVMKRMIALERQSAGANTSLSQAHWGLPYYYDDHSPDEILPDRRQRQRLILRRRPYYDTDHSLDEVLPDRRRKQRRDLKGHPHFDEDHSLDEVLPDRRRKQRQASRGHPHHDENHSLDDVLPDSQPKKRQTQSINSHFDDDHSRDEVLPDRRRKQHQAHRGHLHHDENRSLDDVLPGSRPKKRQAQSVDSHFDDDQSLDEVLPDRRGKQHQAHRGHPHHGENHLLDDVLPDSRPRKRQTQSGHSHCDDDHSLDEVLPSRRRRYR
ncbi:uncharacterized protein [Cicer arietinum]|nr:uncharacterized protein LOC101490832 isoform X2 [Cicer arietinum]